MEFPLYAIVFVLMGIGSFWLVGGLYGLSRKSKMYFPLSLAAKMYVAALVAGLYFMGGGILLATFIFNAEMEKRNDYKRWPTIIAGLVISTACSALVIYSARYLIADALQRGL